MAYIPSVLRCSIGPLAVLWSSVIWASCGSAAEATDKEVPSYAAILQRFPLPGTKRVYLHQPCDYKLVEARPDFRILTQPALGQGDRYRTAFGFALLKQEHVEPFDYRTTRQQLAQGALPLLQQTAVQEECRFEQTVFTTVDAAGRPLVMLRLRITPHENAVDRPLTVIWQAVRQPHERFHSHPNEDYIVFESSAPAWQSGLGLSFDGVLQKDGETVFSAIHASPNVSITPSRVLPGDLECTVSWKESRQAQIEVTVPYQCLRTPVADDDTQLQWRQEHAFQQADKESLTRVSFDEEYSRQVAFWEARLAGAAQIEVPETLVSDVYRALTLSNLQFLGSALDVAYCKPGQGGFNNFSVVYGWESSHFLSLMDRQGFQQETRRTLDYFLTTQQGNHGPEGDVSTAEGCFRPHIHWMCETGAILGIFADHAVYSGDRDGLRRDSAALLKAARWIQQERARTKETNADGSPVLHYGLMPRGRATDWPESGYFFWTDAYTWRGLDKLAHAYAVAQLPEASWLCAEADDYRSCILEAVRRSLRPHPLDPSLLWVPSELYEDPAAVLPTATYFGPLSLVDAGVIPADDPLIPAIEASLRRSGCLSDDFAFHMRTMEDAELKRRQEESAGGPIDLYYVTNGERAWHRIWLERQERIKALRYFYMTLACATSRDVHVTQERYCPQLPWLLPWQPNGSGNGRVLEMILTTLAYEKGDSLQLLFGAPDAWFASEQPLGVTNLRTSWGPISFRLVSGSKPGTYQFSYDSPGRVPEKFRLALPSGAGPEQRRIVEVRSEGLRSATRPVP